MLNGDKTVVLTNDDEAPSHLWTQTGIKLQVKNGSGGHICLGRILGVGKAGRTTLDLTHHLQGASKAFSANKTIFCDRNVPVKGRLRYFDAVVSPVAHFGCGHRTVHQKGLHQLDVACHKFLRAVVGPPSNLDWSRPCTKFSCLEWKGTISQLWSHPSLSHYWKLAVHFVSMPHDRWIQRILRWMPEGRHTAGCPGHYWATKLDAIVRFCKWTIGKYWHKIRYFGYISRRVSFNSANVENYLHYEAEVTPAFVFVGSCTCDVGFRRSPAPKWAAYRHAGLID